MQCTSLLRFSRRVVVSVAVLVLAACSDGAVHKRPVIDGSSPAVSAPKINAFTIKDASDSSAKDGDSAQITSGGSVFVTWDVTGAKSLEIARLNAKSKLAAIQDPTGKSQVDGLTADETFELTAYGDNATMDQRRVTVKVVKKDIKILSFVSKPAKIKAGDTAQLCWTISDSTAKVAVKANGEEIYPGNQMPADQPPADGYNPSTPTIAPTTPPADSTGAPTKPTSSPVLKALSLMLSATITPDTPPADGYATPTTAPVTTPAPAPVSDAKEVCDLTVTPADTTTYTLSVKDGDKEVATQDAKVEVEAAPVQFNIAFVAQPTQLSVAGPVTLTWRVTPDDAKVDIDNGVTTGDKANGEKSVTVSQTTTFTLTATTKDGQSQTKTVTVTVGRSATGFVTAKLLTPTVFAGESAQIAVSTDNTTGKLTILDPQGNEAKITQQSGTVTISSPVSGAYTATVDGVPSNPVALEVRSLAQNDVGNWGGIALKGMSLSIVGAGSTKVTKDNETVKLGMASLLLGQDSMNFAAKSPVDFGAMFGSETHFHGDYVSKIFSPFAVNAVVFDPKKPKRVYAAVSGGVLYSDNNGGSWDIVDLTPLYDSGKYRDQAESHSSCGNIVRNGSKSAGKNWLVNIVDVCDLALDYDAAGNDRLLIATDYGVVYIDGVDGRINNRNDETHFMQGRTNDNPLFGKVVNKLALMKSNNQTTVIAAASDGVYINAQRGDPKAWKPLNAAGLKSAGVIYSLAVSGSTIFAGTDNGLFSYNTADTNAQWMGLTPVPLPQVQPKADTSSTTTTAPTTPTAPSAPKGIAVKAIAVDASDPATLYIGTDKGIMVSRDCGASAITVTSDVGAVRNIATTTDGRQSAVVLTSAKGLFSSVGTSGKAGTCGAPIPLTADNTPTTQPPPQTGNGPGTVKPN